LVSKPRRKPAAATRRSKTSRRGGSTASSSLEIPSVFRTVEGVEEIPPAQVSLEETVRELADAVIQHDFPSGVTEPLPERTDPGSLSAQREIDKGVSDLRRELAIQAKLLLERQMSLEESQAEVADLRQRFEETQRLQHLFTRVGSAGQDQLRQSLDFRRQFSGPTNAFVLSIDIRRSTDLMLKARQPKLYAEFILDLAVMLRQAILDNFGVFDKFTGDGVLGFFPEFYSGTDAGLWAVRAAFKCQETFDAHYKSHRRSFITVLKDTGLGIGLDFGRVEIVEIGADLTVVGTPVVYACRMSGARAGITLANQPAYERLFDQHLAFCDFREVELDVKNEGRVVAYEVSASGKAIFPAEPDWRPAEPHVADIGAR
jgi:class 3 adenylate cyclase